MKEIAPGIHSSKWTEGDLGDIVQVLTNQDEENQIDLIDIDGTLHEGFYDRKLRGITNADISLLLAVRGFFGGMNTPKFLRYVKANIDLFMFEK